MDSKLPSDLIIEILSRTSLKDLNAMRCTSKAYNNLTYDSHLVQKHRQRNNIVSGVIIQHVPDSDSPAIKEFVPSHESDSLDLSFLPKKATILSCSDQGIIVFESATESHYWYNNSREKTFRYCVSRPATKQILQLPELTHNYVQTKLVAIVGIGSNRLHYKIFRFFQRKDMSLSATTYYCDIFDSRPFIWTKHRVMYLPSQMLSSDPLITSGGSVYCLMSNCDIFKFNAYSDKWSPMSSPYPVYNTRAYTYKKLLKYEGKLGLACKKTNGFWEIWIHTIDQSWERTYILNKTDDIRGMSLDSFYDSDTSVMLDHNTLIFHRFKGCDNIDKANDISKKVTLSHPPSESFKFQSDHRATL